MAAAIAVGGPLQQAVTAVDKEPPLSLPPEEKEMAASSPGANFEIVPPKRTGGADEFEAFPDDVLEEVIEPAYYYENSGIPVFTPTMEQFKSFKGFVEKINHYGMQSGIVKIIPPKEWRAALPPLDEKVKDIKVKNPIEQHIAGVSGEYRQTNVEKQRTYNLPQWRALCEASDHQPPAKRGERRKGQIAPVVKRATRSRRATKKPDVKVEDEEDVEEGRGKRNPPTPKSPEKQKPDDAEIPEPARDAFGRQPRHTTIEDEDSTPGPVTDAHGRQPRKRQPVRKSAKQREAERELADEVSFEDFDYRIKDAEEYTPERCEELEKAYWRTLSYNSPLYGADMPGSLFDETTTSWNVADLKDGILDLLGKKLPGVNTAYLYLGMWKATFSWHLEDMDLYSINYIHFGAPKQWYSISREDKAKFEQVMKSIWPNDAKKCPQYLRHKTYLVSPSMLAQHGIKVNRLVHHEGEFVITFPFGYHSGYNLGYNCAESVNFATTAWLEYGRQARKCECVDDSVFVDVEQIERKLRGEPTDDEESESDDEEYGYYYGDTDDDAGARRADLPTPPESVEGKNVKPKQVRKRKGDGDGAERRLKKRARPQPAAREPCILCPNDIPSEELVPTEDGHEAHRLCAIYTPEVYFRWDAARHRELVAGVLDIPKARFELKCGYCKSKKGSCFQCSQKKCVKAYHATCAAAAGVLINIVDTTFTADDGNVHPATAIDYRCKIHRPKRSKNVDGEQLEDDPIIRAFGRALAPGDTVQFQFIKSDIFAGVVIENRPNEDTMLLQMLPHGDVCEVEWKWILVQDPRKTDFPDAIITAPLHADPENPGVHGIRKVAEPPRPGIPQPGDAFCDGSTFVWDELELFNPTKLVDQEPIDLRKNFWYYLGELSTEYISKFSEDPRKRVPNSAAQMTPQRKARSITKPPSRPSPTLLFHPSQPQYTLHFPLGNGGSYYYGQSSGYAGYPNSQQSRQPQQVWPPVYRPSAPIGDVRPIKTESPAVAPYALMANYGPRFSEPSTSMPAPPIAAPVAPMAPMASMGARPGDQSYNGAHAGGPYRHQYQDTPSPSMNAQMMQRPQSSHSQSQSPRNSVSQRPYTPHRQHQYSQTPPLPSPLTPSMGSAGGPFGGVSPSPPTTATQHRHQEAQPLHPAAASWQDIQTKLAELAARAAQNQNGTVTLPPQQQQQQPHRGPSPLQPQQHQPQHHQPKPPLPPPTQPAA